MKKITQEQWDSATPHGYTEIKPDGTRYLLYMGERGTTWGPVEIASEAEAALSRGRVICTTCGESLSPFGDYWVHSRTELPDHQPTYITGEGVHAP